MCLVPTVVHDAVKHAGSVYYAKMIQVFTFSDGVLDILGDCLPETIIGSFMGA